MSPRERDAAWSVIRQARGLGIELRAVAGEGSSSSRSGGGQVLYRPVERMPAELLAELQAHRVAVLLTLDALATPVPPDGAPGKYEACRFCGAHRWTSCAAVWHCGRCDALWRPARTSNPAPAPTAQASTAASEQREVRRAS